ncbi:hypothetical protein [Ammoniphilus sp. CFH 90114]|uniref:hypothetical protein n=1 Tax=Ammoniphilus sp. CFH 90114 TaxID=2493665 RepID=UPI00100DC2AA|nr:hypothetical protein [Ammoniphilus sp. CFH 90114]RXT04025.1 hypothetical protein EIZ39_21950 [Ammoniphilus sp. CFH 90114]
MKFQRLWIVLIPCTVLRFYLGLDSVNFLWFALLYLPFINWTVYWIMFSVRVGLNKLKGEDWIPVPKLRAFYVWYLHVPGSLVLSEIIHRGYVYNFIEG